MIGIIAELGFRLLEAPSLLNAIEETCIVFNAIHQNTGLTKRRKRKSKGFRKHIRKMKAKERN